MALLTIEIPDEYVPGVEAAKNAANKNGSSYASAQEYATAFAAETALRWCEQYRVGQFWVGPLNPEFNADGSPFAPPVQADDTLAGGNDTTAGGGAGE